MPINSANNGDTSQLLREISKLNLSGTGTGFKYVKHANCELVANKESLILDKAIKPCLREVIVTTNTESNIELYWDDGINKVKIPDKIDKNCQYFDYRDGGLILSVLPDVNSSIDIFVRSTEMINYQVGNVVTIPTNEDIWYTIGSDQYQYITPFKVPIKPVFLNLVDSSNWMNYYLNILPYTLDNGYEWPSRIKLKWIGEPLSWQNFSLKRYYFNMVLDEEYGEYQWLWLDNNLGINQDNEKWVINLI